MTNLSSSQIGNESAAKNVVLKNASPCDAIRPMSVPHDRVLLDGVTVTQAVALEHVAGVVLPQKYIPGSAHGFDVGVYVDSSMCALAEPTRTLGRAGAVVRNSSTRRPRCFQFSIVRGRRRLV